MNIVQLLKSALDIPDGRLRADLSTDKPLTAKVLAVEGMRIRLDLGNGRILDAETQTAVKVGDTVKVVFAPTSSTPAAQAAKAAPPAGGAPALPGERIPPSERGTSSGRPGIQSSTSGQSTGAVPSPGSSRGSGPVPGVSPGPGPAQSADLREPTRLSVDVAPGALRNASATAGPRETPSPVAPATEAPAAIERQVLESLKPLLSAPQASVSRDFNALSSRVSELLARLESPEFQPPIPGALRGQLGELAEALRKYDALLGQGETVTESDVRKAVEQSGLFLESRLLGEKDVSGDLKALLLRLKSALDRVEAGESSQPAQAEKATRELADLVGQLRTRTGLELADIESRQATNILTQNQPSSTTIAIPLAGDFRRSELIVSEEEGHGSGGRASATRHRVVLQLDMSSLGELRVDALSNEGRISIGFVVPDEQTRQIVESGLAELRKHIEDKGCIVSDILVRTGDVRPQPPESTEGRLYSLKA